ncbi:MAG: methyltransferase [Rhodospirillales bacterium]|nr:methyltransferase [Rhodospirillales bacterium]MDE2200250.1 methyltransferase [Rhodospirillales bacterium]MDE2574951.1 methyltransferase [Rhodospirillales bacterium]
MTDAPAEPTRIMEIGTGFMASRVLLSAVELDVFGVVGAQRLSAEALRQRLDIHPRAATDFFDALVSLGLLVRAGEGAEARYANTPETAAFLDPASPSYMGSILTMAGRRLYQHWGNLTEGLRTGLPQNEARAGGDPFEAIYADPQRLEEYVAGMAGVQHTNFRILAERFNFARHQSVCDVGGASGALCIAIAQRHPQLTCISFDLPQVTPLARRRVAAAGLADRIEVRSGNFLTDDLPRAEVIVMGNILHDWGTATKQALLVKAYAALPPGGVLIAVENIIDDARRENTIGLLMSLNMLIETRDGYDYTFPQFDQWCRTAGFRSTGRMPLAGPASAALAWK